MILDLNDIQRRERREKKRRGQERRWPGETMERKAFFTIEKQIPERSRSV